MCRGRLLLLCVCAWGAELAVGRVRCTWGKRGIAWRGANGARAVGAPPPRVVTACGRGEACGLASSSPRAVLSRIAHARLRVRSADVTSVRRAPPRPRASASRSSRETISSAKPPELRRVSRLRCTTPGAAAVARRAVARRARRAVALAGAAVAGAALAGAAMAVARRAVARRAVTCRAVRIQVTQCSPRRPPRRRPASVSPAVAVRTRARCARATVATVTTTATHTATGRRSPDPSRATGFVRRVSPRTRPCCHPRPRRHLRHRRHRHHHHLPHHRLPCPRHHHLLRNRARLFHPRCPRLLFKQTLAMYTQHPYLTSNTHPTSKTLELR